MKLATNTVSPCARMLCVHEWLCVTFRASGGHRETMILIRAFAGVCACVLRVCARVCPGGDRYADRGMIPRALTTIFERMDEHPEYNYRCFISFLEIYNENIYDLLDRYGYCWGVGGRCRIPTKCCRPVCLRKT